jgi:chromosome segregation ATPase
MSCETDLEVARIEKAAAHAELNTLSREIPKYQAEIARLKDALASSEEQTRDLRGQLESVQAHNRDLLERSLSLQVQILGLQAENETLRNQTPNQKS